MSTPEQRPERAETIASEYDALLLVSFGGPEKSEDVIPFLEHVLRGKRVPRERMLEVAEHYYHFGGRSPINDQNRALLASLESRLSTQGPRLPVYWGNRHWHPFLADTIRRMRADGVRRALALVTSAYASYSGCRQYREAIEEARREVGEGAPVIDKIRAYFNHPGFIETMADRVACALEQLPPDRRGKAAVVFTAHSIPVSMAQSSGYVEQLLETIRLVCGALDLPPGPLVYQSRSGPPSQPWLEPDICDYLRELAASGAASDVIVVPVGFVSDHMEVLYDLDTEARALAGELGLSMVRASTAGNHPRFISMVRDLILERIEPGRPKLALGSMGPSHDFCPPDCCPYQVG